jgi:CBS domain-containing protein
MKLLQMCDDTPASVTPESSVAAAIGLMVDRHVGAVAVLDSEQRVTGIFTERDVLRKIAGRKLDFSAIYLRDFMTTEVETLGPDARVAYEVMTRPVEMATTETTAGEALNAMVDAHFRHLPIVDSHGRLLGMLSVRNLLQARIDDLTHQLDCIEQYANDSPGG